MSLALHFERFEARVLLAAGQLDPSFAGDGIMADFAGSGNAIVVQPDGRIIVAGEQGFFDLVARFNPDGSLDPTFSDDGLAHWALPSPSGRDAESYDHVALQPSGNILVSGTFFEVGPTHFIYQIDPRGNRIDNVDVSGEALSLIVAPDGRIYYSTANDTKIFSPTLEYLGTVSMKGKLALQPQPGGEPRILALSPEESVLRRHLLNGDLDESFQSPNYFLPFDLAVGPRGEIAVLVQRERPGTRDRDLAVVAPFTYIGPIAPQHSFGAPRGLDVIPSRILYQGDGKIIVSAAFEGPDKFIIARITATGELDPTFGNGGFLVTNVQKGESETPHALAITPDQTFLSTGTVNFEKLVLIKYQQDAVLLDESTGTLFVRGTTADDTIVAATGSQRVAVSINDVWDDTQPLIADVKLLFVQSLGGDDRITIETVAGAYVAAGDGNDTLIGGIGNDSLTGGAGKNRIFGGPGDDRLSGSSGHDFLSGDDGHDRLYGNAGNDTLIGGGGVDRLFGGAGDDLLSGGSSNDKLFGEAGDDSLFGGRGADIIDGGDGDDSAETDSLDLLRNVENAG